MGINNLIARFLANKATKEEYEQLESWKNETRDNLDELLELKAIWNTSLDIKDYEDFDKEDAWSKINEQVLSDTPKEKSNFRILPLKWLGGIAAAIVIIVFSTVYYPNQDLDHYNALITNTQVEDITLADGSMVLLNRKTTLRYNEDFKSERKIILEGEAFFEVARDENHPFEISTKFAEITVLGTSFNVDEDEDFVNVYVTSGKVKVTVNDQEVILGKNEMVRCSKDQIEKISLPGENYLSWKTNKLIFNDTPLHKAIVDIAKHYNQGISFSPTSKAMNIKVSDVFENQDFESVMEQIALITGVQYATKGSNLVIE